MSVFNKETEQKIEHYLQRYETRRSAILPILHLIQDEYGWIQEKHILELESRYQLSKVHVLEVATFYSMYRLEEPKKYRILFCDNVVCTMMGAKKSMKTIRDYMDSCAENGTESPFSLEGVPCLGVCDGAPAMLINKDRHLLVSPERAEEIIKKYHENSQ